MLEERVLAPEDPAVKSAEQRSNYGKKRQALIDKARAAGCKVEEVCLQGDGASDNARGHVLLINGHRCEIHALTTANSTSPRSKRRYIDLSLSCRTIMKVDAVVFYTAVPGFSEHVFVVPSALLRAEIFQFSSQDTKMVYLPMEKLPPYKNRRPRIDYWEYENAWTKVLPPKRTS